MNITLADIDAPDVLALLSLHQSVARTNTVTHTLSIGDLRAATVSVFCARNAAETLMGIAAVKHLSPRHGEIKSVRTHPDFLRRGVSRALMAHIHNFAKDAGFSRLSLETHPTAQYAAARALYEALGYEYTGPFGDYHNDPASVFMTFSLCE